MCVASSGGEGCRVQLVVGSDVEQATLAAAQLRGYVEAEQERTRELRRSLRALEEEQAAEVEAMAQQIALEMAATEL